MNNYVKKGLMVSLCILFLFSVAYAENGVTEGYDENTEVTIRGTMKEVQTGMRGPLIVILQAGNKDYRVITGPQWYIAQQEIELTAGTSFEVTGSKYINRDGNLFIVASRLKNLSTGKIVPLRDPFGMPLWRGRGMKRVPGS